MKLHRSLFLLPFVIGLFCIQAFGQIPNPGFETWLSSTQISQWYNNDIFALSVTPVTQSTDAHSGSYAVSGQVVSYSGLAFTPYVVSGGTALGFPVSQQYATLTGYYKFASDSGDQFIVTCLMKKSGAAVGVGEYFSSVPHSNYTQFSVSILYPHPTDIPDTCLITISIGGDSSTFTLHLGATFLVDDLSFGASTAVNTSPVLPTTFRLEQNFPNPFNPSTNISYSLPREEMVTITVSNVLGEDIATLLHSTEPAGNHVVQWNAAEYPSGLYFYRMTTKDFTELKKMVYLK